MSDIETPPVTPQQYEILHGGGAEAAEIANQRLSRRRFLRRSMLVVWGTAGTAAIAGALNMLYPGVSNDFGSALTVGKKSDFPAASPDSCKLNIAGVFRVPTARTYLVHLAANTSFLLSDSNKALTYQLEAESIVKDTDGTYWMALYQRCVHLGCTVPYRDDCSSFKCPCHGSHYAVDGEFIDGPAPRSLDRFQLSFSGQDVVVNTGAVNQNVQHPDDTTRLIAAPTKVCSA